MKLNRRKFIASSVAYGVVTMLPGKLGLAAPNSKPARLGGARILAEASRLLTIELGNRKFLPIGAPCKIGSSIYRKDIRSFWRATNQLHVGLVLTDKDLELSLPRFSDKRLRPAMVNLAALLNKPKFRRRDVSFGLSVPNLADVAGIITASNGLSLRYVRQYMLGDEVVPFGYDYARLDVLIGN